MVFRGLFIGRRWREDHVEVDSRAVVRVDAGQFGRHRRTPVSALRAVPLVAEALHQSRFDARDLLDVHAGITRRL